MIEKCIDCGLDPHGSRGTIYVRRKIGKDWCNVPQCEHCWLLSNGVSNK